MAANGADANQGDFDVALGSKMARDNNREPINECPGGSAHLYSLFPLRLILTEKLNFRNCF
jgi:hypothetical protein